VPRTSTRVKHLLAKQLEELLRSRPGAHELPYERALRVGAASLRRGAADEITSTTIVGSLLTNDHEDFETLVADIAEEFGLDATIRLWAGSFSVRFCRPERSMENPGI
jgi:hypothetical protein